MPPTSMQGDLPSSQDLLSGWEVPVASSERGKQETTSSRDSWPRPGTGHTLGIPRSGGCGRRIGGSGPAAAA